MVEIDLPVMLQNVRLNHLEILMDPSTVGSKQKLYNYEIKATREIESTNQQIYLNLTCSSCKF